MLMQNDGGDGCVAACTPRVLSVYEHGGKKEGKEETLGRYARSKYAARDEEKWQGTRRWYMVG